LLGGGMRPTAQLRHARWPPGKQRPQQASRDGEADPFGLGRGGEAGEVVRVVDDRPLQLSLEAVALGAEAVVVVLKIPKQLAVVGTVNGLKDFGSVAVEGLARRAGEGGLSGDGAVGALANSSGVVDAKLGW